MLHRRLRNCAGYNNWKCGMEARPPYLAGAAPADLERRYVARQAIYLLGNRDIVQIIPRSTRAVWPRPKALTAMCAAIPTRP